MATFAPFLMAASAMAGTVSSMKQASAQEKAQSQAQALQMQQAQSEIAALERQRSEAEEQRRDRLERATAAQRAAFAAGGVSSDGSGDAVFGNLLAASNAERDSMNAEFDRRIQGLQSGIQMNLLRRAPGRDGFGQFASLAQAGGQFINAGAQAGWFK